MISPQEIKNEQLRKEADNLRVQIEAHQTQIRIHTDLSDAIVKLSKTKQEIQNEIDNLHTIHAKIVQEIEEIKKEDAQLVVQKNEENTAVEMFSVR